MHSILAHTTEELRISNRDDVNVKELAKTLFQTIGKQILPEYKVEMCLKIDPQDIEESKIQLSPSKYVALWMSKLEAAIDSAAQSKI